MVFRGEATLLHCVAHIASPLNKCTYAYKADGGTVSDFGFQSLEIYQLAKTLVVKNYRITKLFPQEERFSLVQQMNRAAISIPSNIVEGYSRASSKEKGHFLNMAYGSLMELVCQYEISELLGYISGDELDDIMTSVRHLAVKISNFRQYILDKK